MIDGFVGLNEIDAESSIGELERFGVSTVDRHERARATLVAVGMSADFESLFNISDDLRAAALGAHGQLLSTLVGLRAAASGMTFAEISALQSDALAQIDYSAKLDQEAIDEILDQIDKGNDLAITEHELDVIRDKIADLSDVDRAALFDQMTPDQAERLFHNVHSSGLLSNDWNDGERTTFYELLATVPKATRDKVLNSLPPDIQAQASPWFDYADGLAVATAAAAATGTTADLESLRASESFKDLPLAHRTAILHQVGHYPKAPAIHNLERLSAKEYYAEMDTEDAQRTAKVIGDLSVYEPPLDPNLTPAEQAAARATSRAINDNSLDLLLDPSSNMVLTWSSDKNHPYYGSMSSGDVLMLKRGRMPAGHDSVANSIPADGDTDARDQLVHGTVSHEINHDRTGSTTSKTFDEFMGEYRARYVGHMAQYGVPPTRQQMQEDYLPAMVGPNSSYANLEAARDDAGEGKKIADFLDEMYSGTLTHGDIEPAVGGDPNAPQVDNPSDPAPVPVSVDGGPNNLDNS